MGAKERLAQSRQTQKEQLLSRYGKTTARSATSGTVVGYDPDTGHLIAKTPDGTRLVRSLSTGQPTAVTQFMTAKQSGIAWVDGRATTA